MALTRDAELALFLQVLGDSPFTADMRARVLAEREQIAPRLGPFRLLDLPAELVIKIFECDELGPFTLAHLCRTCKAVCALAQPVLFSRIPISFLDDNSRPRHYYLSSRTAQIERALRTSPRLAAAVQLLRVSVETVSLVSHNAYWVEDEEGTVSTQSKEWLLDTEVTIDDVVKRIVPLLSNITSLMVAQLCDYTLDTAFLEPFTSFDSVRSLRGCRFSPAFLAGLKNLKDLRCNFPFSKSATPSAHWSNPPTLETLALCISNRDEAVSGVHLHSSFAWLTRKSGQTLQTLNLTLTNTFLPVFASFSSLTLLLLDLRAEGRSRGRHDWGALGFSHVLDTLPPSLRRLTIHDHTTPGKSPASFEDTYLTHLPSTLHSLYLHVIPFAPSTIFELLRTTSTRLPHIEQLELYGKPYQVDVFALNGPECGSLWREADWATAERLGEREGIVVMTS